VCLYWLELALAITSSPGTVVSLPRNSSVIPSAKYWSAGRPRFSKGSTATRLAVLSATSWAERERLRSNSTPRPTRKPTRRIATRRATRRSAGCAPAVDGDAFGTVGVTTTAGVLDDVPVGTTAADAASA
jgi:hypothetical protein